MAYCLFISVASPVFGQNPPERAPTAMHEELFCMSNLEVTRFRLANPGPSGAYNDKVVFGRDINYRAKPGQGSSWSWKFLSLMDLIELPDNLTAINPDPFSDKGTAHLPEDALPLSISNSALGDNYGVLRVSKSAAEDPIYHYGVKVFFNRYAENNSLSRTDLIKFHIH